VTSQLLISEEQDSTGTTEFTEGIAFTFDRSSRVTALSAFSVLLLPQSFQTRTRFDDADDGPETTFAAIDDREVIDLATLVPGYVRERVERLVRGEGAAAGFPAIDRPFASEALRIAGSLRARLRNEPTIAPSRDGSLTIEIRIDADRELFVELNQGHLATIDVDGADEVTVAFDEIAGVLDALL